jgi:hypothetical protein
MTETSKPSFDATIIRIEAGYPPHDIPTIYADGVANVGPSPSIVKFYLFRSDPEQLGGPSYKNQVVAQVVMSTPGFIQAAIFLERALKQFTERGTFNKEMVEKIRAVEGSGASA